MKKGKGQEERTVRENLAEQGDPKGLKLCASVFLGLRLMLGLVLAFLLLCMVVLFLLSSIVNPAGLIAFAFIGTILVPDSASRRKGTWSSKLKNFLCGCLGLSVLGETLFLLAKDYPEMVKDIHEMTKVGKLDLEWFLVFVVGPVILILMDEWPRYNRYTGERIEPSRELVPEPTSPSLSTRPQADCTSG